MAISCLKKVLELSDFNSSDAWNVLFWRLILNLVRTASYSEIFEKWIFWKFSLEMLFRVKKMFFQMNVMQLFGYKIKWELFILFFFTLKLCRNIQYIEWYNSRDYAMHQTTYIWINRWKMIFLKFHSESDVYTSKKLFSNQRESTFLAIKIKDTVWKILLFTMKVCINFQLINGYDSSDHTMHQKTYRWC